jgi:very-short-patch-repair endonuclease
MFRNRSRHEHAATMRSAPTMSEALLWQELRGSKLGVGFRRQLVIGRFIVDFAAPAARLVVEVDGGYHAQRVRADARRDRELERLGWRVLRVEAALVQHRLGEVVAVIRAALAAGGCGARRPGLRPGRLAVMLGCQRSRPLARLASRLSCRRAAAMRNLRGTSSFPRT